MKLTSMTRSGKSLAVLAISAMVLGGLSTTTLIVGADAAYAKGNGNGGGGNGNGNGHGADNGKGGKGQSAARSGQGASRSGKGSFRSAIGSLFGNKQKSGAATHSTEKGPKSFAGMHPSQLGSMNGAINASINAVIAHINNGNTNGPVGAMAALAMADHNAVGAQGVLDLSQDFQDLESALAAAGYTDVTSYYSALEGGAESDPAIDDAITALGGDPSTQTDITAEAPTDTEVADAEDALAAVTEAEVGIMDAWNKSNDATDEQKDDLLGALRDQLDAESEAISEAIDSLETTETVVETEVEDS